MDVRLLGPVHAVAAGGPVDLGPRRQRFILAVLALQANQPIPVSRLIDLVWPESAPRTAAGAVAVSVSGLRSAFARAQVDRAEVDLVRHGSGYLLRIDESRVDAFRFRALVAEASSVSDDVRRVALLDKALASWTGPALDGTAPAEVRERLCRGLEEARLSAVEERTDALLRLGHHGDLIDELSGLLDTDHVRERLAGQLMLALYRCGRTGEALAVYRGARRRLAEELGVEPGPALREMHLAMLRQDGTLDVPENPGLPAKRPAPAGPPAEAGPVPRQLPPALAGFVGREADLDQLTALIPTDDRAGAPVVISAIAGSAGIGKTTLAVHWAHRYRDRFPDGQLYANLRGYGPGEPLAPLGVLTHFLRSLGVPADQVPADVADAGALYRTVLADRRVMVLLDNVRSADQVRPLLPGESGCLVLVTSRDRLSGLVARDGARRIVLDVLSAGEAYALLSDVLGTDRAAAQPDDTARLAALCGYLPLALRIAAANLADQPDRPISDYVAELGAGDLLGALRIDDDPELAVRSAFDLSLATLADPVRRMFRLFGLVPVPDIPVAAAAALAGCDAGQARAHLDRLAGVHLVYRAGDGRYAVHDLLRRYAQERVEVEDGAADRAAATDRLLSYYLVRADAAARLRYPHMQRLPRQGRTGSEGGFTDPAAALAWLDAERANVVVAARHAATTGPRPIAWLMADALRGYLWLQRHIVEWHALAEAALAAAEAEDDLSGQALAHLSLAQAKRRTGEVDPAENHYLAACDLAKRAGWEEGNAAALASLADLYRGQGRLVEALDAGARAGESYATTGARNGLAAAHCNLGHINLELGRLREAVEHYRLSLAVCAELGITAGRAYALTSLGAAYSLLGRPDEAHERVTEAVELLRETGPREGLANTLGVLSTVCLHAGAPGPATGPAEEAVALVADNDGGQVEADAFNALAEARRATGRLDEAVEHGEYALGLAHRIDYRIGEVRALIGLASAHLDRGAAGAAEASARRGLALARRVNLAIQQADALTVLAAIARLGGDEVTAAGYRAEADALDEASGYALTRS